MFIREGHLKMAHTLVVVSNADGSDMARAGICVAGQPTATAVMDECLFLMSTPDKCSGICVGPKGSLSATRCSVFPAGSSKLMSSIDTSLKPEMGKDAVGTINLVSHGCTSKHLPCIYIFQRSSAGMLDHILGAAQLLVMKFFTHCWSVSCSHMLLTAGCSLTLKLQAHQMAAHLLCSDCSVWLRAYDFCCPLRSHALWSLPLPQLQAWCELVSKGMGVQATTTGMRIKLRRCAVHSSLLLLSLFPGLSHPKSSVQLDGCYVDNRRAVFMPQIGSRLTGLPSGAEAPCAAGWASQGMRDVLQGVEVTETGSAASADAALGQSVSCRPACSSHHAAGSQ